MLMPKPINKAFTAEELIQGFAQNGKGNCVSIATIKASLMAFKTKPIFKKLVLTDNKFKIEMRDGFILELNTKEYSIALEGSKFKRKNIFLAEHAILMFASMAKRAQLEGNDNKKDLTYLEAIESLNNGEHYLEGPKWLGLTDYIIEGPNRKFPFFKKAKKFLLKKDAAIGKSPKHVWFSSNGKNDEYGNISKIRRTTSGAIAFNSSKIATLQ